MSALNRFATCFSFLALSALSTGCTMSDDEVADEIVDSSEEALTLTNFRFATNLGNGDAPVPKATFHSAENWVMSDWNAGGVGNDMKYIIQQGKEPYVYLYTIAARARAGFDLTDCNTPVAGKQTLCQRGAEWIKTGSNFSNALAAYANVATQIQATLNANGAASAMVHVEPDWFQYTVASTQTNGNALTYAQSNTYLQQIFTTIKTKCSKCQIVMDASLWPSATTLEAYFDAIDLSKVSYLGVVGGAVSAKSGNYYPRQFSRISHATGKKFIVNTANSVGSNYGAVNSWLDTNNIKAMWNSGVAAVIVPRWDSTIPAANALGFMQTYTPIGDNNGGWTPEAELGGFDLGWSGGSIFQPSTWNCRTTVRGVTPGSSTRWVRAKFNDGNPIALGGGKTFDPVNANGWVYLSDKNGDGVFSIDNTDFFKSMDGNSYSGLGVCHAATKVQYQMSDNVFSTDSVYSP